MHYPSFRESSQWVDQTLAWLFLGTAQAASEPRISGAVKRRLDRLHHYDRIRILLSRQSRISSPAFAMYLRISSFVSR